MTTFALVHGAWHGAWCWDLLRPELEARGHEVVAVELPCEDVGAGCSAYAAVVVRALEGCGDDVVLVGHSLGGLTIPLVAAARDVRKAVFLCALIPVPGAALVDQLPGEPRVFVKGFARDVVREDDHSYWPSEQSARVGMYPDCPDEIAAWAAARLRRQGRAPNLEPCPLPSLPEVETVYILGNRDEVVAPEWSRLAARERLGVEPIELDAGHSPYLTCPGELADVL